MFRPSNSLNNLYFEHIFKISTADLQSVMAFLHNSKIKTTILICDNPGHHWAVFVFTILGEQ